MTDLAHVYKTLLSGDDYGRGDHWQPVWPIITAALPDGGNLLDVGCGRGGMVTEARSGGIKAEGCDIAPCKPWITRATLPRLPYATGQFDVVGCFDVLEHLPESDIPAACAELIRVTGKRLIVSVAWCSDPRMVDGVEVELHLTRRPIDWWREQFDAASTVIPSPGQPEWRHYLSFEVSP